MESGKLAREMVKARLLGLMVAISLVYGRMTNDTKVRCACSRVVYMLANFSMIRFTVKGAILWQTESSLRENSSMVLVRA